MAVVIDRFTDQPRLAQGHDFRVLVDVCGLRNGVRVVGNGDGRAREDVEIHRRLTLAIVGERVHEQRVSVEDHLAGTGNIGEAS